MYNPHLAEVSDIEEWADNIDSRSEFPNLIRRLILATADVKDIHIRAQEGTDYSGWDGRVKAEEGGSHVPEGRSGWEMGTGQNPKSKAESDYEKRTEDPDPFDPSEDAFVFCTPRRWANKDDWVDEKREEGEWRDVRAYDADDLATWLANAPGVHLWLSLKIGMPVSGVQDVFSWWEDWKEVTSPELTADVLLSGRSQARAELLGRLGEESTVTSVHAESMEEARAFIAASLSSPEASSEGVFGQAIIVKTKEAWRYYSKQDSDLVLIPQFRDPALFQSAVKSGHHVVLPAGENYSGDADVNVSRVSVMEAREKFEEEGLSGPEARHYAGLLRRSLLAFRRVAADIPPEEPDWAEGEHGPALLPLLLAGQWDQSKEGDRNAVAQFADTTYEEIQDRLNQWRNVAEPPFRQVGSKWRTNAKEVAWRLLCQYADRSLVKRFADFAIGVLTEKDPQRELSEAEQLTPRSDHPERSHSDALRKGIADTVGMLGVLGDIENRPQPGDGTDTSAYATRIVRELLERALEDADLWLDLAPHLRQLAEAAPDTFLSLLEQDLQAESPSLLVLFEGQPGLISPKYPYPKLLWALHRLAWSSAHFTRVVSILARLTEYAPETQIANSPMRTLHSLFRIWLPQCGASQSHRFDAVDKIREDIPEVAWELMLRLLPTGHDTASIGSGPGFRGVLWREWPNEAEHPSRTERIEAVRELSRRVVEDVTGSPDRWLSLIDDVHHLPPEAFDTAVGHLEENIGDIGDEEWKRDLGEKLRGELNRHRAYSDADWSMPDDRLDRLHQLLQKLEEEDPVEKAQWLFSDRPNLPVDAHAYNDELRERRTEALRQIVEEDGDDGVVRIAENVDRPAEVGRVYANLDPDASATERILDFLDGVGAQRSLAEGFVNAASRDESWRQEHLDVETLKTWDVSKRVSALLQFPLTEEVFDLVDQFGEDTARLFWRKAEGIWRNGELLNRAAENWIQHDRPRLAIHRLAMVTHDGSVSVDPELAQMALAKAAQIDPETDPANVAPHHINALLTVLRQNADGEDVDPSTIEQLEWDYLPAIHSHLRNVRSSDHYEPDESEQLLLHRRLSQDPEFFVEVIDLASAEDPESETPDQDRWVKKRARLLLESWRGIPGYSRYEDSVDEDYLLDWLEQVESLLEERDLVARGHRAIGRMLRWGPGEDDGIWPLPAVCNALEELSSEVVDNHFRMEVYNSRGVTSRGPHEGGGQERALAEKYDGYAEKVESKWPRVASILRGLADTYRNEAERMDRWAERDQDDFGKG